MEAAAHPDQTLEALKPSSSAAERDRRRPVPGDAVESGADQLQFQGF